MELLITETFWGADSVNKRIVTQVTAEGRFPCVVGNIPEFGKGKRNFRIYGIMDGNVFMSVSYANSAYNESWVVRKGRTWQYRTPSVDAGYYYDFELI